MESWISWLFSCVIHFVVLLLLAIFSLAGSVAPNGQLALVFENSADSSEDSNRIFDFSASAASAPPTFDEVQPLPQTTSIAQVVVDDLKIRQIPTEVDLAIDAKPIPDFQTELASLTAISASMSEKKGMSAGYGDDSEDMGDFSQSAQDTIAGLERDFKEHIIKPSEEPQASFFGTDVTGKKFVFVVDSSRSMTGPRWRVASYELMRSLHELMSDTEFFVICFDLTDHSIFSRSETQKFLVNDPKTLRRAQSWLESLELGRGTFPSSALAKAVKMAPDAIFLLSDGVIQDDSIWMLRNVNHDKKTGQPIIPIHTILLLSPMGRQPLEVIAAENGGTFKDITLDDLLP